jgi:signal transduction histidine kinase
MKHTQWNPTTDRVLTLIFATAAVATVCLSLLLFFSIKKHSIALRHHKSERDMVTLTRFLEHYFTSLLKSQKLFTNTYSKAIATPLVKREMKVLRNALKDHFVIAVSLVTPDMKLLHTVPESDGIGSDLSFQAHNRQLAKTNRPIISSPFDAVQGPKTIAVATPLKSVDGDYKGALTYLVDFDALLSFLVGNLDINKTANIHIFDENKTILYATGGVSSSSLQSIISENASSNSRGFISHEITDDSGRESIHFISYSFLFLPTGKRWMICMDSPEASILPSEELGQILTYAIPIAFFLIGMGSLGLIRWLFIKRHTMALEKTLAEERKSLDAANSCVALMLESLPYMIFELNDTGVFTFLRISPSITDCEVSDLLGTNIKDSLGAESVGSFESAFKHILSTGKPLHALRISFHCNHDAPPKTCSLSAFPVFAPDGGVSGVNGIMHDITERVVLEASLIQTQKMEVIGAVTSSVAHDFNNYLATMLGCVDLIRLKNPELEDLDILRRALNKAAALTDQLLSFSRVSKAESEVCDINSCLRQTIKMIKKTKAAAMSIKFELAPNLPDVRVSQSQLDQIVMNLVVNAYDAMPDGGEIVVRTWKVRLDSVYAEQLELMVGEYVMLELSDNGPGMDEKTRSRVFEPYFTTKSTGTGLGLATVYTIVKQINGRVILNSAPGRGTTFSIYIPTNSVD